MTARRTVPQIISLIAVIVGTGLFALTVLSLDRDETVDAARRLGPALPVVLIPGAGWHLLRTLGWFICFPATQRPTFWRLFRVRLAADGVAYFTIRGVASEPLRVMLLLDQVPATVSAAAAVLERTAMGIMSVVLVGSFATMAMYSDMVTPGWQQVFRGIALVAVGVLLLTLLFLTRTGRYVGPLFERIHRRTGWRWTSGRVVRFLAEVEKLFLDLARTDHRRLWGIVVLSLACFALMAIEVWLVFWAIGEPVGVLASAFVETFTRSASVFGGAIPANLGALEAANVAVAQAMGLAGAGSLALARRVRSLIWAAAGLALFPRDAVRAHEVGST